MIEATATVNEGVSAADIEQSPLHYKTTNLISGFERRGKLSLFGVFDRIILSPETPYLVEYFHPATFETGMASFVSSRIGFSLGVTIPPARLFSDDSDDTDNDGLSDVAEDILGTNPNLDDSDSDGVKDGAEIDQGTDPLDGQTSTTGIVATAPVDGNALDICLRNDMAVVTLEQFGVAIFNVFSPLSPVLVNQIETPGTAEDVACGDGLLAVADGTNGLVVIDISQPANPLILHEVDVGGSANVVIVSRGMAFVGANNTIVVVDLQSGTLLSSTSIGSPVHDMALRGEELWVVAAMKLRKYELINLTPTFIFESNPLSFGPDGLTLRHRIFAADGLAYVSNALGYDVFDIQQILDIPLVGQAVFHGPQAFKSIVLDGGGIGVAAVGTNPGITQPNDISLYDTSDPQVTDNIQTSITTPGVAFDVELYKGYAYVADRQNGLQVINYRLADTGDTPPTVELEATFSLDPPLVQESFLSTVSVVVTDDVAVRFVEFYLDGNLVERDGTYPFDFTFLSPELTTEVTQFTFQVRATDTGGNSTWSDEVVVDLDSDPNPPELLATFPFNLSTEPTIVRRVTAVFNEALDPTISNDFLQVLSGGEDGILDTADDILIMGQVQLTGNNGLLLELNGNFLYHGANRGMLDSGITDLAGNAFGIDFTWEFTVDDMVAPRRISESPFDGQEDVSDDLMVVTASFDEEMSDVGLSAAALTLIRAGPDRFFETGDDTLVIPTQVSRDASKRTISFTFDAPLPPDFYRAVIDDTIVDLTGNPTTEPRSWEFIVPVHTALQASVEFSDGSPAPGVTIRNHNHTDPIGQSDGNGEISIPLALFSPYEVPDLDLHLNDNGAAYLGRVLDVALVASGTTDLGTIVVEEVCLAELTPLFGGEFDFFDRVRAFATFDAGSGETIYATAEITEWDPDLNQALPVSNLYLYSDQTWTKIDGEFSGTFNAVLRALAVFDDGRGPALYVGGYFDSVNGITANNIARWDGQNWEALGTGLPLTSDQLWGVNELIVYDDGSGPELYAGGFEFEGFDGIARWDGSVWSSVGTFTTDPFGQDQIHTLAVHDDGQGDALFMGGSFLMDTVDGVPASIGGVARFKGGTWSGLGAGLSSFGNALEVNLNSLAIFGGNLIAGGGFDKAGTTDVKALAQWNGTTWSAVGSDPDRFFNFAALFFPGRLRRSFTGVRRYD